MDKDTKYNPRNEHSEGKKEKPTKGQEDYHFIREVVKNKEKDPHDWKKKLGVIVGAATLFGVIAATTFMLVLPIFEPMIEQNLSRPIKIPADEQPQASQGGENEGETKEQTSSDGKGESDTSKEGTDPSLQEPGKDGQGTTGDGTEQKQGSDSQATDEAAQSDNDNNPANPLNNLEKNGSALEEYKQIYREMIGVSKTVEPSLVTVIGVTKDVDWFNNTYESQGQTAGLVVADNGRELFILTEYHIIEDVDRILVTLPGDVSVDAKYQKHDSNTGLTIIKVDKGQITEEVLKNITIATLGNSYKVCQGEPVIALGNPMGYSHSLAYGIITSVTNKISKIDAEYSLLTTDIQGSSDGSGILINLEGEIIGVIAQDNNVESNRNIITGYAMSELKSLIEALSNNQGLIYLGIKGQDVTQDISSKAGIPVGIYVNSIETKSPALKAGIQSADVIVKVDDAEVTNLRQYRNEISKLKDNQIVTITIMRIGPEGYVEIPIDVVVEAL